MSEDDYRLWLVSQDYTEDTMRGYVGLLRLWSAWCAAQRITAMGASHDDIARWLSERRHLSSNTLHHNFVGLRAYYRWLRLTSRRPDDPTEGFKMPRVRLPPVQPYAEAEAERLLAAVRTPRDRALLLLLSRTGLRASEVVAICEEDIDWQAGTLRVWGKGRKWRLVAPGPEALESLRAYIDSRPRNIWGLQNYWGIRTWFRRLSERAGITANLHRWRHTFATRFFEATECEGSLQKLLGHAGLEMSHHYSESVRVAVALRQQRRFNGG